MSTIAITGATGFIGSHLARALLDEGVHEVRALGRDLHKGLALQARGADFRPVDLTDRVGLAAALDGAEVIVHSGALPVAWAPQAAFDAVNVEGTRHVADLAATLGVRRLIYISSPSVLSRFRDQLNLTDETPAPPTFASRYSATKHEGEVICRAVEAAHPELEVVIIRPKAVYGPGDNALFPRILAAAEAGRLPRIGDGRTCTNLTHVSDVVAGLLAAIERPEAAGQTYALAGPVANLWDTIEAALKGLGYPLPTRHLSTRRAMRVAAGMEAAWDALGLPGEPPLTRYTVGILSYTQTYRTDHAERDLGFAPKVSVADGLDELIRTWGQPGHDALTPPPTPRRQPSIDPYTPPVAPPVRLTTLRAGSCQAPGDLVLPDHGPEEIDIPALFAHIEHPALGHVLFDTGYSPRFLEATARFPYSVYGWLTPMSMAWSESAREQLRDRGVAPEAVTHIILSHIDPDHYGGLRDFSNARVHLTAEAWASVRGKTGLEALAMRLLPGHMPDDLAGRLRIIPARTGPPLDPFGPTADLLGDGTALAFDLPGHAPGQIGALIHTTDGPQLLVADGCWSREALRASPPFAGAHLLIAHDKKAQLATYDRLAAWLDAHPTIPPRPSHELASPPQNLSVLLPLSPRRGEG